MRRKQLQPIVPHITAEIMITALHILNQVDYSFLSSIPIFIDTASSYVFCTFNKKVAKELQATQCVFSDTQIVLFF